MDGATNSALPSDFILNHVAFVPQNDVLIRNLTVEQLLYHSARSRLPAITGGKEIDSIIDNVLQRLDIEDIRYMQVGSSSDGLSMGDRKKVNIAVELVAGPQVSTRFIKLRNLFSYSQTIDTMLLIEFLSRFCF